MRITNNRQLSYYNQKRSATNNMLQLSQTIILILVVRMNTPNYICVNCQTHFPHEEMYKAHYKSEHHRYNVKRKLIAMPPLSLHQYTLQFQAQMSSKSQSNSQIYCQVCSKKFMSAQTYKQHINSSKHKTNRKALLKNKSESSSLSEFELIDQKGADEICPFCVDKITDDHLNKQHCFPPFRNQCVDLQGLLQKVKDEVKAGKCVYCNYQFGCEESAKQHMNDVGHAKLDIDNFGLYEPFYLWKINQSVEEEEQQTAQVIDMQKKQSQDSLLHHETLQSLQAKRQARIKYGLTGVIINGKEVGYRAYRQYYKQHLQREVQPAPRQHLKSITNQNWNLPKSITYFTQKPQFQQVQSHNNPR